MRRLPLVFVLLLVSFSSTLLAQTADTASLQGSVVDVSQAAVSGAELIITNETTGLVRRATSNEAGLFSLVGLPVAGSYEIRVAREGFEAATKEHLSLTGGSSAVLRLTMRVKGEFSTITVKGSSDDVRVDQPQLGIDLTRARVLQVPLPNRRITYLPLLNAANRPAINQGDIFMSQNLFTTNGAGRRQAWFEVDGANADDMWGRQTVFSNVPLMAVDEMAILTNSFSAEYGASAGSVVNVVTRSGGADLHGQVLELWRPANTQAHLSGFTSTNASSGNQVISDVVGQTAVAFSGALGSSGKAHYFAAGEYNREAKASPITSPIAPGSFVGHYRGWLGFLRLDRQFSQNHNSFFRTDIDSFSDTNPNGIVGGQTLATVARTFRRRTYTGELGDMLALSAPLVNNIRLQFQLGSPITEFDPNVFGTQFVVPVSTGGTFTSGTSQNALLMNRQYQFSDTLAYSSGRSQLILGADVIDAHTGGNSKEFGGPIFLGRFTYNTCTLALSACESPTYLDNLANVANYQQSYGNANYLINDQLWSVFAQEDYRPSQRLTINAGIRYERQTLTDSKRSFAPRMGFVYDASGDGSLIVRGGFGIYYSQVVDNSFASYALGEPSGVFTYQATPGQVGFPSSVAAAPVPAFPASATQPLRSLYVRPGQPALLNKYLPTSVLKSYPSALSNPYSEQYTASIEHRIASDWVLSVDYVGTHTVRINRPLDVDGPSQFVRTVTGTSSANVRSASAANCTRPYWVYFYQHAGLSCVTSAPGAPVTYNALQPPYSVIQTDVNDGYLHYNALDVNVRHLFSHRLSMLASYTWAHTLDNVDPDTTSQNPNDTNLTQHTEYGPAIYDQRHRAVVSGLFVCPFKINVGGVSTFASGLPYNIVTGTTNSGDTGATTDRPVISGAVIGRNAGRGNGIYSVDPFVSRTFSLFHEAMQLDLRAEAFNVLNHANFVGYSGTYGNGTAPGAGFGLPLSGVTNQLTPRFMQFSTQVSF